jgi:hydroxysqualene dehydroxylase
VSRRVHVVGAGVAGLAAAVRAVSAGHDVNLYEGAPQAGGRCRTVTPPDGFAHDNGTHVLLTANGRALAFLDAIGARRDWIEPEPEGLPVFDACTGALSFVGLSPWSWLSPARRPPGLGLADLPRLLRLALPLPDRPIGAVVGDRPIRETLIEPLTVAVLNTPLESASARRLGRALRRMIRPGSARLLVARHGLGPDLVEPALAALRNGGATVRTGTRLREIATEGRRAVALRFADATVPLDDGDVVILALPPAEVKRLLPALPVPERFEPIVNAHYRASLTDRPRFVGLVGTLSQWVLARPDHVSVTVSAAGAAAEENPDALAARIWREIAPALAASGLPVRAGPMPEARVVKEKRATVWQGVGDQTRPPLRPLANLALAGDWLTPLPATIESAVVSGERAVELLGQRFSRPARADRAGAASLAVGEPS